MATSVSGPVAGALIRPVDSSPPAPVAAGELDPVRGSRTPERPPIEPPAPEARPPLQLPPPPPSGGGQPAHVIKRLSFVFYGESGRPCLRIYDARSGELIKSIPPYITAEDLAANRAPAVRSIDIKV